MTQTPCHGPQSRLWGYGLDDQVETSRERTTRWQLASDLCITGCPVMFPCLDRRLQDPLKPAGVFGSWLFVEGGSEPLDPAQTPQEAATPSGSQPGLTRCQACGKPLSAIRMALRARSCGETCRRLAEQTRRQQRRVAARTGAG